MGKKVNTKNEQKITEKIHLLIKPSMPCTFTHKRLCNCFTWNFVLGTSHNVKTFCSQHTYQHRQAEKSRIPTLRVNEPI